MSEKFYTNPDYDHELGDQMQNARDWERQKESEVSEISGGIESAIENGEDTVSYNHHYELPDTPGSKRVYNPELDDIHVMSLDRAQKRVVGLSEGAEAARARSRYLYENNEGQMMTNAKIEMEADQRAKEAREEAHKAIDDSQELAAH